MKLFAFVTFINPQALSPSMYKKRDMRDSSRSSAQVFSSKKGQVTLFIILGLLLLLAVTLVIVLRREVTTFKPEEVTLPEAGKIENIVRLCVAKLGNDALSQMGLQGGYIDVPPDLLADGSSYLKLTPFIALPYWAIGNDVRIPSLFELEERLNQHLEKNLRGCVFSQEEFLKSYDLAEHGDPIVKTTLGENKVAFAVEWEIEIKTKSGETVTTLTSHDTALPIRFKRVYDTAQRIMEQELSELKFEDLTQDLISLEHPKLPVSGVELSCSRKVWKVKEAQDTLKNLLRINLQQLKAGGTEFVEFPEELSYYQNHYLWNLGEKFQEPDIDVVFSYDNFPMTFQVTPSEGALMKSGAVGGAQVQDTPGLDLISDLCVQNWKFTYDVIYPVVVKVTDRKSGYQFQIAFTVHLIRNTPNRAAQVVARAPGALPFANSESYCAEAKIPMTVRTWELVENDQGVYWQDPLRKVEVSFTCLKFPCQIGTSGDSGELSINFPYCTGGILRGKKSGYKETWQRVVTENGKPVDLFLLPLYQIPVSSLKIVKHEFQGAEEPAGSAQPLEKGEIAVVRMKAFKAGKEIYSTSEEIHKAEQIVNFDATLEELRNITLLAKADFTYSVDITVFDGEELVGGYRANATLPWSQLEKAKELTFHVLTGKNQDDAFEVLLGLPQYSTKVPGVEIK